MKQKIVKDKQDKTKNSFTKKYAGIISGKKFNDIDKLRDKYSKKYL